MNWVIKFAYGDIEQLLENRPWLLVDDNVVSAPNLPKEPHGKGSFLSIQKGLISERGWDWFRTAIRGRVFPNLGLTTFTSLEPDFVHPEQGDPPEILQQVREKFPHLTLLSLIGTPHVIPGTGTGFVPPQLMSSIIRISKTQKWKANFEKSADDKEMDV